MIGTTVAFVDTDGVACIGIITAVNLRKAAFVASVCKSEAPRLIGKHMSFDASDMIEGAGV